MPFERGWGIAQALALIQRPQQERYQSLHRTQAKKCNKAVNFNFIESF